jgi:hypothetical protein
MCTSEMKYSWKADDFLCTLFFQLLPSLMAIINNQDSPEMFDSDESDNEDSSFDSKKEGVPYWMI